MARVGLGSPAREPAPVAIAAAATERQHVAMLSEADQLTSPGDGADLLFICLLPSGTYDLLDGEVCHASEGAQRSSAIHERPAITTKAENYLKRGCRLMRVGDLRPLSENETA